MVEPTFSVTTERIYDKLPDLYCEADIGTDYQFKKFISAMGDILGEIDLLAARLRYKSQIELEYQKRYSQKNTVYTHENRELDAPPLGSTSDLVDPRSADESWLPWIGQLVGVRIVPEMNEIASRDAIQYASTGYRAGSKDAIEKAARSVLSGSRYAVALPHTKVVGGNIIPGTVWDLTILTRNSESPDPIIILNAVNQPTLKPAGVKIYTRTYQASWDALEAALPYWKDWNAVTWDQLEQVGFAYYNVAGNLVTNPSFEVNTSGWSEFGACTIARVPGGADGTGQLQVDFNGTGEKGVVSSEFSLDANVAYTYGVTYRATVDISMILRNGPTDVVTTVLPASATNRRVNTGIMPSSGGNHTLVFRTENGGVTDEFHLDAVVVRDATA